MTFFRRVLLGAIVLTGLTALVDAQRSSSDWPQYRGQNRDGSASSFAVPREWPEQLVQKWKVEVGLGYATPIVVGNRVYMFSRRGDNEVMSALDADTGKELWQTGYPVSFTMNSAASVHGPGPKSTPVFADGKLLSIGMTGVVTAFDASTGKQLWQKPGSTLVPTFTTHAFSPLVDGGNAIFHVGGDNQGAVTAFDIATGTVKWSWPGDGPSYGSPIVADLGGTRQLVAITQGKVIGLDVTTGALLWERPYVSSNKTNSITPILHGQTMIVSGNGGPTVAFTVTKTGNQWTTTTSWENADIPLKLTNMVLVGDLLFGLTTRNAGQYFGVDATTGRTLWTSEGRQAKNAAIERIGDLLVSLEDDGELVIARGSRTAFEPLRRYKVADADTWAEAALCGDRIFVKDVSTLALWRLN